MPAAALSAPSTAPASLQSGVRFRAYPGPKLSNVLAQWIGHQRLIYSLKAYEDRALAQRFRETGERSKPSRGYAQFHSPERPWLKDVPSQILRNGADRWYEGKLRQLKGLAKAPQPRTRANFNSVLVSSELFRFKEVTDPATGDLRLRLELGTAASPVGFLPFKAHRPFGLPKQIVIRREGRGQWFVSFSYAHEAPAGHIERSASELAYELDLLDDEALAAATVGIDRNVKDNCVATSDGRFFTLSPAQRERLRRKEVGARRHQKRIARKVKGSANRSKECRRYAAKKAYQGRLAQDFSHKTSAALVKDGSPRLLALEDLKMANMVRKPKAKQDPKTGKWLRNGARAKAGLTSAILRSSWGRIAIQLGYKAQRAGALVLKVPAAYSSQECSRCAHTHPENRHEQRFFCQRCGFTDHADTNAGRNIAARAIGMVRGHEVTDKAVKRLAKPRRKTKTGREAPGVPVESTVSRAKAQADRSPRSTKQEAQGARSLDAPTTAPQGV
jgi:putative transposase